MLETTTPTPSSPCPSCGKRLDAAFGLNHNCKPKPGDVTLCIGCGSMLTYRTDMTLEELTPAGFRELDQACQNLLLRTQEAINDIHRGGGQ